LQEISWGKHTLDRATWVVFFGIMPPLWATGVWLFAHSGLTRRKKVLWALFLISVGVAVGFLLPLAAIRNRFLILFALLPVLALIDVKLAQSNRTFLFWLRACSFEVCTVFTSAALTRLGLTLR
jgi:hypothetical protein